MDYGDSDSREVIGDIVDRYSKVIYADYIIDISQKEVKKLPKSFSEQEREYIRKRLKEEAATCMGQFGIRRTTVDEIVKRVNIPKGTFYLFYKSKELLLFDVIQEQHELINQKLFQSIQSLSKDTFSAEKITDVIFDFYKMTEEMPIFKLLSSEEIDLLVRKLPREVVEEHLQDDSDSIQKLFSFLPVKKEVDIEVISAAFHAIYYSTLHKEEIGAEKYDEALRMLIYGLITQIKASGGLQECTEEGKQS